MDERKHNTFILYTEQWDALKYLTDAKLGKLFRCLYNYLLGTLKPSEITEDIRIAFMFLKTQINIDKTKYEKVTQSKRKAAERRWGQGQKYAMQMQNNSCTSLQCNNDNVNGNSNVNGNVYANVNGNGNAAINNVAGDTDGKNPSVSAVAAAESEGKKEKVLNDESFKIIFDTFNYIISRGESKIPLMRKMTPERQHLITVIANKYEWEDVKRVFKLSAQSRFLNARTDKHFLATFDWIMKEKNFFRILEGNFND